MSDNGFNTPLHPGFVEVPDDEIEAAAEALAPKPNGKAPRPIVSRQDYMQTARTWLKYEFMVGNKRTLHFWRGDFWQWTGTHYAAIPADDMKGMAWQFLEGCDVHGEKNTLLGYQPKGSRVADVLGALAALTGLSASIETPAWLDGRKTSTAGMIAMQNGVLDIRSRKLHPHNPALFATWALDFPYEKHAAEPAEWLRFLASVWPDDQESIDTLQEMIGYLVSGDTRQQKAFLIVGPRRSGKGTIGRIVQELMGAASRCSPTLSSLAGPFGLQQLIGKPLALISDARISGRADQAVIVENMLRITGEDALSVDRKFKEAWAGLLPTRFLLMTNELPRLMDTSGALAGRFVTLVMSVSFYGREDLKLMERLLTELPAILIWALDGYQRLTERGAFVEPESSRELVEEMEELGSPIGAFVKHRCVVGVGLQSPKGALYGAYNSWCADQGQIHIVTEGEFGRSLLAAVPGIKPTRPTSPSGKRYNAYSGIGLLS